MTTRLAAIAAAALLAPMAAAAAPPPPASASPPGAEVHLEGDVTYEPGTGRVLIENGAVLRRGAVTVRARSATYDPATGEVRAVGGVLLTDPLRAIRADSIRAVLGGEWQAEGVVAFVKDVPVDLGGADTIEAARAAGRNRLSFSGARLEGDPERRFRLDDARLTLCDCPGGCAPSWEVTSRKADVVPGKRAILTWPVLRVTPRFLFVNRPVPVLALPWLYLPLGERQTGLLLPAFRQNKLEGFVLAEPLYVTLGRSADATLTAEYAFGGSAIRGPGASLELRWAPAVGAEGSLRLTWLRDEEREGGGAGGDRFALEGGHAQRIGDRTSLAALVQLAGDPVWVRDHHTDAYQWTPYRRSAALLSSRWDALALQADAGWLQPLRPNGIDPARPWRSLGADDRVSNRWPGLAALVLPSGVGPFELSGRIGAVRYAPAAGSFDADGRPAATRADARAEVSAPLLLGGALSVEPYLRGAAAGYSFEASRSALASASAVGGVAVATELSRRFGELRHAIAPRLELRAGTAPSRDGLPWLAWDALDRTGTGLLSSGPPGAWEQLRASIATRLSRGAADLVRVEAGQDLDVRRGRFAETFVSAAGGAGGISADASARFLAIDGRAEPVPPPVVPLAASRVLDRFTELHANVSATDRRGDSLRAGLYSIGQGGSGVLVAGLDPLFDLRPAPFDATAGVGAGARGVLGPATFGYDVDLAARDLVQGCRDGTTRRLSTLTPSQHRATFVWNSPCRCFRVVATANLNACGEYGYDVSIDIAQLASARRGL
ncbi:MAG TPA: LPS-assembly protein LptD [Anaeromyxobacter sp.]|nr:LPS-assembly protein LptD [Anaeromyxobacter sp.]